MMSDGARRIETPTTPGVAAPGSTVGRIKTLLAVNERMGKSSGDVMERIKTARAIAELAPKLVAEAEEARAAMLRELEAI